MSAVHGCLRCGHEGPDVAAGLVDRDAEARAGGETVRRVEVVQVIPHRHIVERVRTVVPELYATEWRCRDRAACDRRYAEFLAGLEPEPMPVVAPAPVDEEADLPWE